MLGQVVSAKAMITFKGGGFLLWIDWRLDCRPSWWKYCLRGLIASGPSGEQDARVSWVGGRKLLTD